MTWVFNKSLWLLVRKLGARIQAGNEFKGYCGDSPEMTTVTGAVVSKSGTLGYIWKGFSGALVLSCDTKREFEHSFKIFEMSMEWPLAYGEDCGIHRFCTVGISTTE